MDFEQAVTSTVSAQEARREIEKHGLSFGEFQKDCGNRNRYKGAQVLAWLGY